MIERANYTPLVSVVVNCHNGERYINRCITSILNQSYKNFEIIFFDNKSTDNTKKIIKKFKNTKIKYYSSNKFLRLYNARKKALKKTKGELIAFLDIDDTWKKNKLKIQVNAFLDKDVGVSCTNYLIDNQIIRKKKKAFNMIPSGKVTNDLLKKNFVGMCTLMIRKKAYDSLEIGFNPFYEVIGDYDLCLRLSENWKISSFQKILSIYSWHPENLSNKKSLLNFKELIYWYKKNKKFKKYSNYEYLKNFSHFHLSKTYVLNKEKFLALREIKYLGVINKLKIYILLLIPINMIRKFKTQFNFYF